MRLLKNKKSFLKKLNSLLEQKENTKYISWYEDTNIIIIKKIDEFSEKILPKYYNHKKFPSFNRQLNLYHFNIIKMKNRYGDNSKCYKNPDFHKDMSDEEIENLEAKIEKEKKNINKNKYRLNHNEIIEKSEEVQTNYNNFKEGLNTSLDILKKLLDHVSNLNKEINNIKENRKQLINLEIIKEDKLTYKDNQSSNINCSGISAINGKSYINNNYSDNFPSNTLDETIRNYNYNKTSQNEIIHPFIRD